MHANRRQDDQTDHDVSELGGVDVATVVAVEDLERLSNLLLRVSLFHFSSHHRPSRPLVEYCEVRSHSGTSSQELGKVDGTVLVQVDLVDHRLQVGLGRVLSKRAHHCSEVLGPNFLLASGLSAVYSLYQLASR